MYPAVERAINNYVGAISLFASVGINSEAKIVREAKEVLQTIIEYQLDQFNKSENIVYVFTAIKDTLRLAKCEGRIFEFTMELNEKRSDVLILSIELPTLNKDKYCLEFNRRDYARAMWHTHFDSLRQKHKSEECTMEKDAA